MELLYFVFFLLARICIGKAAIISEKEFKESVKNAGYSIPKPEIYPYFAAATTDFSREEIAMFITQLIIESHGFAYREEPACIKSILSCPKYIDNVGLPNKSYHGRGYIQLTWGANYNNASIDLGFGDLLLKNPEIVATDIKLAVSVSTWFWRTIVRPHCTDKPNQFGATTMSIKGTIVCEGADETAHDRYKIYLKVASVLKIKNIATENGCYN